MNAYFVSAGKIQVLQEYIGEYPRYEPEHLCDIVFAETKGKAKATFAKHYGRYIHFTDIKSCRIIAKDVNRKRSVAKSNDEYWETL